MKLACLINPIASGFCASVSVHVDGFLQKRGAISAACQDDNDDDLCAGTTSYIDKPGEIRNCQPVGSLQAPVPRGLGDVK